MAGLQPGHPLASTTSDLISASVSLEYLASIFLSSLLVRPALDLCLGLLFQQVSVGCESFSARREYGFLNSFSRTAPLGRDLLLSTFALDHLRKQSFLTAVLLRIS